MRLVCCQLFHTENVLIYFTFHSFHIIERIFLNLCIINWRAQLKLFFIIEIFSVIAISLSPQIDFTFKMLLFKVITPRFMKNLYLLIMHQTVKSYFQFPTELLVSYLCFKLSFSYKLCLSTERKGNCLRLQCSEAMHKYTRYSKEWISAAPKGGR